MIYVMSDIHGCLARYKDIMRQIRLKKDDHLYVLGDVIDRGRYGLPILMDLVRRPNVTVGSSSPIFAYSCRVRLVTPTVWETSLNFNISITSRTV